MVVVVAISFFWSLEALAEVCACWGITFDNCVPMTHDNEVVVGMMVFDTNAKPLH